MRAALRAGGFVCGFGCYDPRNRRQIATLLGSPACLPGCGSDATAGFRPSGTTRIRPDGVNAAFMLSSAPLKLIMKIGPLPDALKPDFHCVTTHWIRGFMAFQLVRRTRTVRLMVPVGPESGM